MKILQLQLVASHIKLYQIPFIINLLEDYFYYYYYYYYCMVLYCIEKQLCCFLYYRQNYAHLFSIYKFL